MAETDDGYHTAYQEVIATNSIGDDFGYDGSGQTVVIIDTGIDFDHTLFGNDFDGDGVADKILFSQDFTNEADGSAADRNGHGTHVAGIIAGSGDDFPGVAPGASIIALQALTASGAGSGEGLERALQWCVENAEKYGITAINMSLGFGDNSSTAKEWFLTDEILALTQLGVAVVSASGNSYRTFEAPGVSYPSSDPYSLSVGATFHSDVGAIFGANSSSADQIAPFSQRDPDLTTVFAPGVLIPSGWYDGAIKSISGTSMATPVVTGAIALIQDASEGTIGRRLSVDEIIQLLTEQSDFIFDGDDENDGLRHTEAYYPRLNVTNIITALENLAEPGFHRLEVQAGEILNVAFGVTYDPSSKFDTVNEGLSVIIGSASDDIITATEADDIVRAGQGDDLIIGNGGSDDLDGGQGDDVYLITGSGSKIDVEKGYDIIILESNSYDLVVNNFSANPISSYRITSTDGDDLANLLIGSDLVIDIINGGLGDDEIYGFSSSDFLFGGEGRDVLKGGQGNDFLFAGVGGDSLYGGEGQDQFVFKTSDLSTSDNCAFIHDFEISTDSLVILHDDGSTSLSLSLTQGINTTELYSNDILVAKILHTGIAQDFVRDFTLEDIYVVTPSYFDEIETLSGVDFV